MIDANDLGTASDDVQDLQTLEAIEGENQMQMHTLRAGTTGTANERTDTLDVIAGRSENGIAIAVHVAMDVAKMRDLPDETAKEKEKERGRGNPKTIADAVDEIVAMTGWLDRTSEPLRHLLPRRESLHQTSQMSCPSLSANDD